MSTSMKWIDRDDGPVNFGEPTYWERRLKAILESCFEHPKGQRILVVGCGHSNVVSGMHAMGYRCITALDISATVISLMQMENQDKEGLEYTVGDVRKMDSQPDELYDCIFDKGCADSLMCGIRAPDDVLEMFRECCRVLRPRGVFLCISHESEGLFAYVCTKWSREEMQEDAKARQDLETIISMRYQSRHRRCSPGGRPGIVHENVIIYSAPPGVDGGESCVKSPARKAMDGTTIMEA